MTKALEAVVAKLAELPADEQDRIARWLEDELRDEEDWVRQFSKSREALGSLAAGARDDRTDDPASEFDDKL